MTSIYLITNKINNKKYVGKTEYDINKRWREHISDSRKEKLEIRPLYRAIRKYGSENFSIKEIERTKYGDERERYWIKIFNTYKNGYNATLGGDGKKYYDYNAIIDFYYKVLNISMVANYFNCDESTIRNILKKEGINYSKLNKKQYHTKKVAQKDKQGNIIRIFNSITEAQNFSGCGNHIGECCNKKRKTTGGFMWEYIE